MAFGSFFRKTSWEAVVFPSPHLWPEGRQAHPTNRSPLCSAPPSPGPSSILEAGGQAARAGQPIRSRLAPLHVRGGSPPTSHPARKERSCSARTSVKKIVTGEDLQWVGKGSQWVTRHNSTFRPQAWPRPSVGPRISALKSQSLWPILSHMPKWAEDLL